MYLYSVCIPTSIASSTLVPSRISLRSWFVVVCEVYSRYGPKACDNEKRRWNQLGISLSTFKDFFITNIFKENLFLYLFHYFTEINFFLFLTKKSAIKGSVYNIFSCSVNSGLQNFQQKKSATFNQILGADHPHCILDLLFSIGLHSSWI